MSYNTAFRQQKAAGAAIPWMELNASIMATTVLGATDNDIPLRDAADVSRLTILSQCALALWEAAVTPVSLPLSAQNLGRNTVNLNSSLKPSRPKALPGPEQLLPVLQQGHVQNSPL